MILIFIFFLLMWNYFSQTFALKWHASQKSQFFHRTLSVGFGKCERTRLLALGYVTILLCNFSFLHLLSYLVLVSLRAIFLQYEALFSKGSWQGGFESSWELLQSLSPFPNRLDTDIGRTPVSAVVFGLACSLLIEGCWLFWKQDASSCFLVHLVKSPCLSPRHGHHAGLVDIAYLSSSTGILAFVETSCYLVL